MQMEKYRHAEFLRQLNIEQGCLGGAKLAVMNTYGFTSGVSWYHFYSSMLHRLHIFVCMYFRVTNSSCLQVIQRDLLFRSCQGRWKES